MPDTVDLTLNNNRFEVSSFLEKAAKVADSVAKGICQQGTQRSR